MESTVKKGRNETPKQTKLGNNLMINPSIRMSYSNQTNGSFMLLLSKERATNTNLNRKKKFPFSPIKKSGAFVLPKGRELHKAGNESGGKTVKTNPKFSIPTSQNKENPEQMFHNHKESTKKSWVSTKYKNVKDSPHSLIVQWLISRSKHTLKKTSPFTENSNSMQNSSEPRT